MSTKDSAADNSTDTGVRYRPKYVPLGVDGDGANHVYRTDDETIHIVRDGERVHVQDVSTRSVDEWMAHIEGKRGWADRRYGVPLADMLTAALEGSN